jgi:conjugative transposon TraK protein
MFRQVKNIDTAFRYIRTFSVVFVLACVLLSGYVIYSSNKMVANAQNKIFILANDKVLEAFAAERKDNIPVEAKDHVRMLHYLFFTLDPDEKVILQNINKALYLGDESVKRQYDMLKESDYYDNLVAGNISQSIEPDSIIIRTTIYPFYFHYKGRQTIVRPSTIVVRSLVAEGYLRNVARSDNNPHGFLVERWRIIENKDVSSTNR